MLYTMFFGISVQGSEGVNARAWISLAGRTFQTSELVKICFMLTYAKHISVLRVQNKINHPLHVVLLALHAAVPVLLCHVCLLYTSPSPRDRQKSFFSSCSCA